MKRRGIRFVDALEMHDRHFERRDRAARNGIHLPTESELLLGMSFLAGDAGQDLRVYAERLGNVLRRKSKPETAELLAALDQAVVQQDADAVLAIEGCLVAYRSLTAVISRLNDSYSGLRLRCHLWLGHMGHPGASARLAGILAARALGERVAGDQEKMTLLSRGLAWASLSQQINLSDETYGFRRRNPVDEEIETLAGQHEDLVSRVVRNLDKAMAEEAQPAVDTKAAATLPPMERPNRTNPSNAGLKVVVISAVGNDNTKMGRDVAREFKDVLGVGLPLTPIPDLSLVRVLMHERFPWAAPVVDRMLQDMVHRAFVRLRPTILLGSPGCGKTRFAQELLDALGLPWDLMPCGGVSDSALGGTPRRWSTGEPSFPVNAIRRHRHAGPGLLLDEVEKASTSRHNGSIADVLIGMIGDETAVRYHDPYLESECDLSHVIWLLTANEAEPLPHPLRDRCRILRFPEPGTEHLPLLAGRLLERHYDETGHDRRWATPLEGFELEALASAWAGGSIRRLERLVEQVARSREAERGRQ